MKKLTSSSKLLRFLYAFSFIILILGFLFISVDFVSLNKNFYKSQFRKNNTAETAELSEDELMRVMNGIINYFSGKSNDLQIEVTFTGMDEPSSFYTEDELLHMADVKNVFTGFRITAIIFLVMSIAALLTLSFFTEKKGVLPALSRGAITGSIAAISTLIIIGLLILLFFEPLFEIFHGIFFPQGNWQFPWDSNMLAVLPESLFMNAAVYIAVSGVSFALLILSMGIIIKIILKNKRNKSVS